ncbi:MAG: thermonuclease family protein [Nanoarchaeota archaeon]|nr:thermonuclease family protein [Nanoarchaeota archaeon]
MKRGVLTAALAGLLMFSYAPSYSASFVIPIHSQYQKCSVIESSLEDKVNDYVETRHKVTRVVDGDTIDVDNGERVRLVGIDTPEWWAPGYRTATRKTRSLIMDGSGYVILRKYNDENNRDCTGRKGLPGRLLRYVFVETNEGRKHVQEELLKDKFASPYIFRGEIRAYSKIFEKITHDALRKGFTGVWDNFDDFARYRVSKKNRWKVKRYIGRLDGLVDKYKASCVN